MNLPSLAIWYQRNGNHPVKDKPPVLELHVNLWRHLKNDINYLDIGILVLEQRDLGSITLYVPFSRQNCKLSDLAHLLEKKEISSAVFNEVLEVEPVEGCEATFYIKQNGNHLLSVHKIDIAKDIDFIETIPGEKFPGFIIKLKKEFCRKFYVPGQHYIRFRLELDSRSAKIFSSDVTNEDGWILSSITSSEITEIRINEVRSIPYAVEQLSRVHSWTPPTISTIHYFLVRDIKFDLIASHANFRKIRRMEPVWDDYLGEKFSKGSARKMLIYHWRTGGNGVSNVTDFVTLAKFRRSKDNVLLYTFLVIALGSIGSGIHSSLSFFLKGDAKPEWNWWSLWSPQSGGEVVAATVWLLVLFGIVGLLSRRNEWPWKRRS